MSLPRPNIARQEVLAVPFAAPSVAATTTWSIWSSAGRDFSIGRVLLTSLGASAQSDTNYAVITITGTNGVAASFSTKLTGGNAALTAGGLVLPVLGTNLQPLIPGGSTLTLTVTITGTLTVPGLNILVEGRLL